MEKIEWGKKMRPLERWVVKSLDGDWQLEVDDGAENPDRKCWLFNFRVTVGAFAPSVEEAMPRFREALKQHIADAQAVLAAAEDNPVLTFEAGAE